MLANIITLVASYCIMLFLQFTAVVMNAPYVCMIQGNTKHQHGLTPNVVLT